MNSTEFFVNFVQKIGFLQKLLLRASRKKRAPFLDYISRSQGWAMEGLEEISSRALCSPSWRREYFKMNELYSHDLVLKRKSEIPYDQSLDVMVEHGLIMNKIVIENSNFYGRATKNVVMSKPRADFLRSNEIAAAEIGPYIHYADTIIDKKAMADLKVNIGKTLLFFPGHSTKETSTKNTYGDAFEAVRELEEAHDFDTVLVCGHFMDIRQGLFQSTAKLPNHLYVSAGYNRCPFFLDLLKTYIELSDVVASNSMGTQAGYAFFLNKPYWVVGNTCVHRHLSGSVGNLVKQSRVMEAPLIGQVGITFEELEDQFRNQDYCTDSRLHDLVSELWGFNQIKQSKQLQKILLH